MNSAFSLTYIRIKTIRRPIKGKQERVLELNSKLCSLFVSAKSKKAGTGISSSKNLYESTCDDKRKFNPLISKLCQLKMGRKKLLASAKDKIFIWIFLFIRVV